MTSPPTRPISPLALWTSSQNRLTSSAFRQAVKRLDGSPYGALWVGEGGGRDPFLAALLALASSHLHVGIGVASIHARDPIAAVACERDLTDAHPGRLVAGYGVSHPRQTLSRGAQYGRPLTEMRQYLGTLAVADERYAGPSAETPPRVIAALGPRMLELAATRASGAHTYCVPVHHTATARAAIGHQPLLIVEQAVVVAEEPAAAWRVAGDYVDRCLLLENYVRNLRRLGYEDADFWPRASRRLVEALVAVGPEAIHGRVREHLQAGATQVCLQVLDERNIRDAAPAWLRAADMVGHLEGVSPAPSQG